MDEPIRRWVEAIWPDVSEPFSEVVPHGVRLLRVEDDWVKRDGSLRRRAVEVAPGPGCPELIELLDEAAHDAVREGWTEIEPEGGRRRFETEGVILSLTLSQTDLLIGRSPTLRVVFDQPWPEDAGAPVETSEMFQNLVRRLLELEGEPARLAKIVTLDQADPNRSDVIVEEVELGSASNVADKLEELGFQPPTELDQPWVSKSSSKAYAITAWFQKTGAVARVRMERRRHLT